MWQILALTSAVFSSLAAVFEKKAPKITEPLILSLVLSFFTSVLALPFLFYVNFSAISLVTILVLFGKSILGAFAFLMIMSGLKKIELSNSLPLLVFTPAVVAILAFFILNEEISKSAIVGMILILVGTYFLQLEKFGNWKSPFYFVKRNKAQWYIISAIVIFSITSVLDKTLLKTFKLQPELFIPLQQLFYTIVFFVGFILFRKRRESKNIVNKNAILIILLIAVFAVIYRYTHILAVKEGSVALVLSIKRTSVFFATLIAGKYFKEKNYIQRAISTAIMVGGAILIIIS